MIARRAAARFCEMAGDDPNDGCVNCAALLTTCSLVEKFAAEVDMILAGHCHACPAYDSWIADCAGVQLFTP